VYVTLQLLEVEESVVNVHELELKLPPAPPSSQVTVPVGVVFIPVLESKTFAVKVVGNPTIVDVGVRVVVVVRSVTADMSEREGMEIMMTSKARRRIGFMFIIIFTP